MRLQGSPRIMGLGCLLFASMVCGCGLPRDAAGTLEFVQRGTMRVGVIANLPWVADDGVRVGGVEGRLAEAIAASMGARIDWIRMPEFELIRALEKREIQLVIGGFEPGLTWAERVAITRPYLETPDGKAHVLAAPPGENAWLLVLDRHLEAHRAAAVPPLPGDPQ